jgi:hypothetical protein
MPKLKNTAPDQILCIYCLQLKPRRVNGDHVLPLAMGGSLLIDRVCTDCDNGHGTGADASFLKHAKIERRRADLQLAGHSGAIPDPDAAAYRQPLVSTTDPNVRVKMTKTKDGRLIGKVLPYVEFEVKDIGGRKAVRPTAIILDPSDFDKFEKIALRALAKHGVIGDDALEAIGFFAPTLTPTVATHEFTVTIEQRLGGHYDGILKMAYELAWHWLGDAWLNDPIAAAMRETLRGEQPSTPLRGKVYDDPDLIVMPVGGDPRVLHVAFIAEFNGQLAVMMRIFDVFAVGIVVSADAARYPVPAKNGVIMHTTQQKYEEIPFVPEPGAVAWHHDPATSVII